MTICLFETVVVFAVSCLLSAMIIPKISLVPSNDGFSTR